MPGYSPKLPLSLDASYGYSLNQTMKEVIKHNFKMLVLTSPGERIMDPNFGVGIRNFLFQPATQDTYGAINTRIRRQSKKYMPHVQIEQIDMNPSDDESTLNISIKYSIPSLSLKDILDINANTN